MIIFENTEVYGWEHAIRGMRNPMNSWDRMDSNLSAAKDEIGDNDLELMLMLANGGPVHAKYRRMIVVYVDIVAPLYWWKEFDTYKVGTVDNSCSTMHKIHEKEFTIDDFSHEHLVGDNEDGLFDNALTPIEEYDGQEQYWSPFDILRTTIKALNQNRKAYIEIVEQLRGDRTLNKKYWWQMIQLLPSSYNQRRTIMLNYEVLANIYPMRKHHKLDEWRAFCEWIEDLPYPQIITGE